MNKDNKIVVFDDTVDIGKEPLPINDQKTQEVFDKLMEKYKKS